MIINESFRQTMVPRIGEPVGNLGGDAYVQAVLSKTEVVVKIITHSPFRCNVDRGTNAQLMAVKLSSPKG